MSTIIFTLYPFAFPRIRSIFVSFLFLNSDIRTAIILVAAAISTISR